MINDLIKPLSASAVAVLEQLFLTGPTWDGDVISKDGRDELIKHKYAFRVDAHASLTMEGVALCTRSEIAIKKEKKRSRH